MKELYYFAIDVSRIVLRSGRVESFSPWGEGARRVQTGMMGNRMDREDG
jgi:hypothetical protein